MDEASRLFQIRRTVMQMLTDRGYIVGQADVEMDKETFMSKCAPDGAVRRKELEMLFRKKDDPTNLLFVFWPEENNKPVGVTPIKTFCDRMKEESVRRAIIVVQHGLTSFAKTLVTEMTNSGIVLECFHETELLFNITHHTLVPKHYVLTPEEKALLLAKYHLQEEQLPRMQLNDPVSRYYGLAKGQVMKIVRPSETAGRYVTYRMVV
eukprot:TRINITY_DN13940_c0_g1_i2.p1 TRINITY_DN13940_c0_g1~~TRINITY_DN13940_c0_g1_i2.p1  ORF type:complete len:208 (-),score=42.96 TRINITY_DN13940_c0_g1_i2:64-687(-)